MRHARIARRREVLRSSMGLLALLLLVTPAGARGAAPSAPATDLLAKSLLTIEDLSGHIPGGIETDTDLDIDRPAFDRQRGIAVLTQAWVSQEAGVVFDERMLFPTPGAALAYLVAAEPTLSEAGEAGLALVVDDSPLTAATRHWAGEGTISDQQVATDIWLFAVGPVAAKVAVTTFGPGLELRRVIAERALTRIEAQFGPANAVWPSGPPGTAPSASASSDIELLQAMMQAVLRRRLDACEGSDPGLPGEVTAVTCSIGETVVVYRLFRDVTTRDTVLADLLAEVPTPSPSAASCQEGPYRGGVTQDGRTWSVACWESSAGLVLVWSEPDQPVLGTILAPPFADLQGLWEAARFDDATP